MLLPVHTLIWSKKPQRFIEEEFKLLDGDEDEDEDASENDENDKFDWSGDTISCWAVIIIWSNFTSQKKFKYC